MVSASHYRDLMQKEMDTIGGLCEQWQNILNCRDSDQPEIPDEASGKIQVAIGQAQLLMGKKFKQFGGLIDTCENGGSVQEVTVDDLEGFWELVYIQVKDIYQKFDEVQKLKENDWVFSLDVQQRQPLGTLNKSSATNGSSRKSIVASKDFSAQAKARLAQAKALARKRMEEQCCQ